MEVAIHVRVGKGGEGLRVVLGGPVHFVVVGWRLNFVELALLNHLLDFSFDLSKAFEARTILRDACFA